MRRAADIAAVIEAAGEALVQALDPAGGDRALPVSPTQLRALRWAQANPSSTINRLAEALRVGASSASRLCDRLEALGFLRRSTDPRDRREVQLLVTTSGLALLDDLAEQRRRQLAAVLAAMPATARQELARSLAAFEAAASRLSAAATAGESHKRSA